MAYEIIQLHRDEESVRAWVQRYKDFRLYALKTEPKAFGSTYAREAAFEDEVWHSRLSNLDAATFMAVEAGEIVGTLTAMQLPCGPEEIVLPGSTWQGPVAVHEGPTPLHYRVYGMYTIPQRRGQGIAKALLAAAVKHGQEQADSLGRPFIGTLTTEAVNESAQALYRKCGFQPIKNASIMIEQVERTVVILQYKPQPVASAVQA